MGLLFNIPLLKKILNPFSNERWNLFQFSIKGHLYKLNQRKNNRMDGKLNHELLVSVFLHEC